MVKKAVDLSTVHTSATVGVVVGGANRPASMLARSLLGGGAASITLLGDRREQATLANIGHELAGSDLAREVRSHALDLDDPVQLAQRLASIRHDEGPVDWIVNLLGPGTHPVPARTADDTLELDVDPPRWPNLSLAASSARVTATLGRTVVVTRLAREEFRHRRGVLVHGWLRGPTVDQDNLWSACEAAVHTLTSADAAADEAAGMHVSMVEGADGTPIVAALRGALARAGQSRAGAAVEGTARW